MRLSAGTKLGPYEIQSPLGAGGMGEVYRARDTRLDRTVAIKVLAPDLAADPQFRERFDREGRAISALDHPNICALYDVGEHDGTAFLVMQYLEGETLADRVRRGPLPVSEAISLARQMADALDAAHEKGIVHRDLKPANVRITPDGVLKVLDFGLAKLLDPVGHESGPGGSVDASSSPTFAAGSTRLGLILGTAAYMSPEQARGLHVDRRADIWAFGCVLFEMLTGRQVFAGPTVTDVLASVLRKEPEWSLLPADLPRGVLKTLTRCLEKDPKRRLRDIADASLDVEDAPEIVPTSLAVSATTPRWSPTTVGAVVAASIAVAVTAGALAGRWWERRNEPASVEWRGDLLGGSTVALNPRVSPDGQTLAFQAMVDGQTQVAVMKPQSGNWTVLSRDRTRGLVQDLSWSHDGTRIFFDRFSEVPRGVYSIPSLGGDERLVLEDAGWPQTLADGSLLLVRINAQRVPQLFHFWPEGGRLEALSALFSGSSQATVRVFPDGREAVFVGSVPSAPTVTGLYVIDLASGRTRRLAPTALIAATTQLAITPDDQWVLFDLPSGNVHRIVRVPRDGSPVMRSLVTLTGGTSGLDVGPDGSLYVGQSERISEVFWYSPSTGKVERLTLPDSAKQDMLLPLPDGRVLFPSLTTGRDQLSVLSPGKDAVPFFDTEEPTTTPASLVGKDRVAFLIGKELSRRIAIASLADGRILRRLPRPDGAHVEALAGSPDGKTLFYVESGVVWAMPSDGGEPRKVHEGNQVAVDPTGQSLIIEVTTRDAVRLVRVPIAGGAEQAIPVPSDLRLYTDLSSSAVAPDGRIAVRMVPKDSWFWPAAILDPRSGAITQLPGVRDLDMPAPAWGPDGRLVSLAQPERSALWRFRAIGGARE